MGNIFANADAVDDGKVEEDFIPSGGTLPTDIYPAEIKYAYLAKSGSSKASGLAICLKVDGKEVNKTIWMTNGQGEVTTKNKKTGKKMNMPGYNQVNSLAMLLCGKEIGKLEVEERKLNLYDFDARREVPQSVECFIDLHGMNVQVALQEQIVDKTEKTDSGKYEPTGETRKVNEIIKFFPEDKLVTLSEIQNYVESLGGDFNEVMRDGDLPKAISKMEEGAYAVTWLEKNRGSEPWDRSTKASGKSFSETKSGGGSQKKETKSLFDD